MLALYHWGHNTFDEQTDVSVGNYYMYDRAEMYDASRENENSTFVLNYPSKCLTLPFLDVYLY